MKINSAAENTNRIYSALKNFIASDYFIYFYSALVLFLSFFRCGDVVLFVFCSVIAIIFITQKNLKVTFVPLVLTYFGLSFLRGGTFEFTFFMYAAIAILIGSIVFYVIKNKPKLKFTFNLKMLIPYMAAYPLGGLLSENFFTDGSWIWSLALLGLVIAAFFLFCFIAGASKVDSPDYIMKILVSMGVVIALQTIIHVFFVPGFLEDVAGDAFRLNWGIYNGVITANLFAIPACFYFIFTKPQYNMLLVPLSLALLIATCLTGSRAALVGMPVLYAGCFITVSYLSAKKTRSSYTVSLILSIAIFSILLGLAAMIVIPKMAYGDTVTITIAGKTISYAENGRIDIWIKSIKFFLSDPVFGAGLFHNRFERIGLTTGIWLSHNTILQALSSLGIVGFIGLVIHSYAKYKSFCKDDTFCFFAFIMFITCEFYGMIDCVLPAPYYILPMIALLIVVDIMPKNKMKDKLPTLPMIKPKK